MVKFKSEAHVLDFKEVGENYLAFFTPNVWGIVTLPKKISPITHFQDMNEFQHWDIKKKSKCPV